MNCKGFQLLLLLLTLYNVAGETIVGYKRSNFTIADIEKIAVQTSSPCPDFSSNETPSYLKDKDGKDFVACEYQYFCHKNEPCLLFNTTSSLTSALGKNDKVHGYYTYNSLTPTEKIIPLSCSEVQLKEGHCSTESCSSNTDCFSNKCVNNVCMVNSDAPAYVCKTTKENNQLKVKCLLAYQETCNNDAECGDNSTCGIDKVCIIKPKVNDENNKRFPL